jgi:hypothetical protein
MTGIVQRECVTGQQSDFKSSDFKLSDGRLSLRTDLPLMTIDFDSRKRVFVYAAPRAIDSICREYKLAALNRLKECLDEKTWSAVKSEFSLDSSSHGALPVDITALIVIVKLEINGDTATVVILPPVTKFPMTVIKIDNKNRKDPMDLVIWNSVYREFSGTFPSGNVIFVDLLPEILSGVKASVDALNGLHPGIDFCKITGERFEEILELDRFKCVSFVIHIANGIACTKKEKTESEDENAGLVKCDEDDCGSVDDGKSNMWHIGMSDVLAKVRGVEDPYTKPVPGKGIRYIFDREEEEEEMEKSITPPRSPRKDAPLAWS